MSEENQLPLVLNVLSLGDSDIDFELISLQLINNGHLCRISRAITEPEFTASIRNNVYDIILADYKLPLFTAFEALIICNKYCPDVPFICVSESIGEIQAIELLKNGAADYVSIDRLERLPFVINRALEETKAKITHQRMVESLHQSEENYQTIFENVQDVFYQTDLNGIIKEISPSIKYFSDFEAKDLVGRPVYEIYSNPDDREILLQTIAKTGEVSDYEIKLKTRSGEIKYASINARLIVNPDGTPDHIDGAIRDITQRKFTEESLQRSEEKYRTFFENVQDVFFQTDLSGIARELSPSIKNFLDFEASELVGSPIFELYWNPTDREKIIQTLSETGEVRDYELKFKTKSGQIKYASVNARLIYHPQGTPDHIDGALHDITQRKLAEESLHQSEEKYRTLFENVQDVFYQTDLNGIIKEISPSIKYFSDFEAKDLVGRPVYEIYSNPDDREILLQTIAKTGEVRDYEIKLKTKHGNIKYASSNARLVVGLDGIPDHIDGAIRDITQRKLAEELLHQSERRLNDIIFSSEDWVWEVDETGRYTYSSHNDNDLVDFAPDEIIGKTAFDFMTADEAKRLTAIFSELVSKKAPIKDLEFWFIGKGGQKICMLTNGVPILDNEGNLKGYRGVNKNITQRKKAEEAIVQSEYELNFAQEIARMGSWNLDMLTNKYIWSKNMYILLGYQAFEKEMTFDDFINTVHPDDKPLIDFYMQEIIRTKAGVSFDFRYLLPDDRVIWIQNNIEPVFKNDELIELHGVNIDITEKKRVEQELILAKEKAEASDRLKTSFLSMISHEIRTPLTEIQGYGQVFTYMNLSKEEKEEYLNIVKTSSKRLINTVTSFIDMAMIASANQTVSKSNCQLEYVLNKVVESYTPFCNSKKIDLLFDFPDDHIDAIIFTDEDLFTKVLNNLIDNAVKFTTNGSVTIGYQLIDKTYSFYIKDTGIGISEEVQQTIFRNFIQADNSDTRQYEGSGLGLSIASGLIKLLDGQIWLESEIGKGSTFRFSLSI